MTVPWRRSLALGAVVLSVAGCERWHPKTAPAASVLAEPRERTRVTLDDGSRVEVLWGRVRDDTLRGTAVGGEPLAIPLRTVQRVEVRETHFVRQLLTGAGIIAATVYVTIAIVALTVGPWE